MWVIVPEQTKHKHETTHLRRLKTILLEHLSSLDHGCGWCPAGNGSRPSCARSLLDPSFRSSGKHTRQFISGDSECSDEKGEEEGGSGEENEKERKKKEKVSDDKKKRFEKLSYYILVQNIAIPFPYPELPKLTDNSAVVRSSVTDVDVLTITMLVEPDKASHNVPEEDPCATDTPANAVIVGAPMIS